MIIHIKAAVQLASRRAAEGFVNGPNSGQQICKGYFSQVKLVMALCVRNLSASCTRIAQMPLTKL